MRVRHKTWALVEWNVDEYVTVRNRIARAVDSNGGQIELRALVTSLTAQDDVSETGIRTCVVGSDFDVADGTVRRKIRRSVPGKLPEKTRQLYRDGDTWRFRMTVNRDHLRGSGFGVPSGVATVAGCQFGETVELDSRLGTQAIRWTRSSPAGGTIRRFLEDIGADEGAQVFMEFRARSELRHAFAAAASCQWRTATTGDRVDREK